MGDMQEEISSFLGVEVVESHERYLGLPTYVGRKKTTTFQYIKDNLAKKLEVWQGKLLSGAGKDILIRVVAQALPTYAMSVFQLTKNFCEDLEQMCARFWWGSTLDKKKIHWKTWNALRNPKEEGGLGFRSLVNFNSAMLAKQAWRVINNPSSLIARLYKAKYFPEDSFWSARSHDSPSYSWRSIFSTRDLLKESSYWQIGGGAVVDIWADSWIPALPSGKPSSNVTAMAAVSKVCDLIGAPGIWNEGLIRSLFQVEEAEVILNIPLSSRAVSDRLVWKLERDGKYSVKSAYRFSFATTCRSPFMLPVNGGFWKKLWKLLIPNMAKIYIWKVCHDILPSLERLVSRCVVLESHMCILCGDTNESTLHICRDCPYTKQVLQSHGVLRQVCYHPQAENLDLLPWLNYCVKSLALKDCGELVYFLWCIWRERNCKVWEGKSSQACDVGLRAVSHIQEFRTLNSKFHNSTSRRGRVAKWEAPTVGFVKINVDGSFHHTSRKGGFGFVIRDFSGAMLAGGAGPLSGLISSEHAEVLACQRALLFAIEQGFMPAMLETDAQEVQRQLAQSNTNTTTLGRIYEDLSLLLESHNNLRVVYINRKANSIAHSLAAFGSRLVANCFYFSAPNFLMAALAAELPLM